MVEPNYSREILQYIPDLSKREIKAGRIQGLETAVLRAVQKSVRPLMTVVAVEDVDIYLSERHGKEIVLNGQAGVLPEYEHKGRKFYRRSDLDALEITIPTKEEIKEEEQEVDALFVATIDAAWQYLSPAQQLVIETIYRKGISNYREVMVEMGIKNSAWYYKVKKAAERIIREVAAGTYTPLEKRNRYSIGRKIGLKPSKKVYDSLLRQRFAGSTIEDRTIAAKVEEALSYLNKTQRDVLRYFYEREMSIPQIAEEKQIAMGSVSTAKWNALKIIKAVLEGTYDPSAKPEQGKKPRTPRESKQARREEGDEEETREREMEIE